MVHIVSTTTERDPRFRSVSIVAEFPVSEGSAAQAVRSVADKISAVYPTLIVKDTPSVDTQSWKIGEPYSERGFYLQELKGVTVDGRFKAATLSSGVVTVDGPSAPKGSQVVIAVTFKPITTVRRVNEVHQVDKLPAWVITDLIRTRSSSLTGRLPPVVVGGVMVHRRFLDVQVTVRGVAHRQADAISMRDALLEAFAGGHKVTMSSCRHTVASTDDAGGHGQGWVDASRLS